MTVKIELDGQVGSPLVGVVVAVRSGTLWLDGQADAGVDLTITGLADVAVEAGQWVYPGLPLGHSGGALELDCYGAPGKDGGAVVPAPWDIGQLRRLLTSPAPAVSGVQLQADVDILTTADSGPREPAGCQLWCLHTDEGAPDASVDDLLTWQQDPDNQSSYTLAVDRTGRIGRGNDDAYRPWSAGPTSNDRGLHLCLKGRSSQTEQDWLGQPAQLAAAARVIADWALRYDLPLIHRSPTDLRLGLRGGCGHLDISQAWGEVTHTDPGPGMPWNHLLHLTAQATTCTR